MSLHILIVDDLHPARLLLRLVCQDAGYTTAEAANGREAVDYLRAHRHTVAAVILDWKMPVLDGLSALRELGFPETAPQWPPIILHTSETAPALDDGARDLGVSAIIAKIGSPQELLIPLQRAIAQRAANHV